MGHLCIEEIAGVLGWIPEELHFISNLVGGFKTIKRKNWRLLKNDLISS